jgi:hypothetical protein
MDCESSETSSMPTVQISWLGESESSKGGEKVIAGDRLPVIDAKGRHRGMKQWEICPVCEQGRWVTDANLRIPRHTGMCKICHNKYTSQQMEEHGRWRGGIRLTGKYHATRLTVDSPFLPMARDSRYVYTHRLVMAQSLGRCLESWETVHHENGNKLDNRLENLRLYAPAAHAPYTLLALTNARLKRKIVKLQAIIKSFGDKPDKKKRKVKA